MEYYGQHGEDAIIYSIFKNKKDGFFVEIGAHDGIRFSNSYLYEKEGWDGIVIEAHPDYYDLLLKNRKCKKIFCAVGDQNKDYCDFYANFRGSLSSLENIDFSNYGKYWGNKTQGKIDGFTNGKISVPMRTIDSIFEENNIKKDEIDILSIDIDGSEKIALKGFNIQKWNPRIVIFEISVVPETIFSYMKEKKYFNAGIIGCNVIFCKNEEDFKILQDSRIDTSIFKQAKMIHPCEKNVNT